MSFEKSKGIAEPMALARRFPMSAADQRLVPQGPPPRFWSTVQDLDMPVAFHVVARERSPFTPWVFDERGFDGVFAFAFLAIDVM